MMFEPTVVSNEKRVFLRLKFVGCSANDLRNLQGLRKKTAICSPRVDNKGLSKRPAMADSFILFSASASGCLKFFKKS